MSPGACGSPWHTYGHASVLILFKGVMTNYDEGVTVAAAPSDLAVARAFGAENRLRLLDRYFREASPIHEATAWQHIYRLLLWIDRTTALAHCYESDKAQPGRVWYARSLAFHRWVSQSLGVTPAKLGGSIDWLFREAVKDLAHKTFDRNSPAYIEQRARYADQALPEPGDDPELVGMLKEVLRPWFVIEPPDEVMRELTRRIYAYITQENKRKNLVGEGFEDTLAAIITRLPLRENVTVRSRLMLNDIRGFHRPAANEKVKRVDLAIVSSLRRTLVSAKWSIRADREEQFASDFEAYARLEVAGEDFDYTLITNEFDAARLKAACERRRQNSPLFTHVVHINPEAVQEVYKGSKGGSAATVQTYILSRRLLSLNAWLDLLGSQHGSQ